MRTQYLLAATFSGILTSTAPAQVIFEDTFGGSYPGNAWFGTPRFCSNFNLHGGSNANDGGTSPDLIAGSTKSLAAIPQGREFAFALGHKLWPFDVPHFNKNGDQYIWTSYAISSFQVSDFSRSISGFTLGETDNVSLEQLNIGWDPLVATLDYNDRSAWAVFVDENYTSNGGLMTPEYVLGFTSTGLSSPLAHEIVASTISHFTDVVPWNPTSINFTAATTTHAIGFATAFSPQFNLNHPYESPWEQVVYPLISSPPISPIFAP